MEAVNKYRNQPTTVDGIRFASKAEARRYGELRLLEKAGEITELQLQPVYPLSIHEVPSGNQRVIGKYVADFKYREAQCGDEFERWVTVVEDVKGTETALFKWKRKHFEAEYGIKLTLIGV